MAATVENLVSHRQDVAKGRRMLKTFPAEVRDLLSNTHPKFCVRLHRKLNF
jgi:hypothetical protein